MISYEIRNERPTIARNGKPMFMTYTTFSVVLLEIVLNPSSDIYQYHSANGDSIGSTASQATSLLKINQLF